MTSRVGGSLLARVVDPRRVDRAAVAAVGLLFVLVAATAIPYRSSYLPLHRDDGGAASGTFAAVLDALPPGARVLVVFNPDIGSYPEIAYATRAALAQLTRAGHRLAFVSFAPEGRALALAEIDRLGRTDAPAAERPLDLGYVSGAEAAMARSVDELEIGAFDLALLVGGADVGPRTWIEQVQPRVGGPGRPRTVAVAPSFLLPELEPYLGSGQLDALIGNPRDGLAYAALTGATGADAAASAGNGRPPSELPVLLGMLTALGVLGLVLVRRFSPAAGAGGGPGAASAGAAAGERRGRR